MKKLIAIIALLLILCCILFIYEYIQRNVKSINVDRFNVNTLVEFMSDSKAEASARTFEEIMAYISEDSEHMIVLGQTGCSHCEHYKPVLDDARGEYNFEYLYIDIRALSYEDQKLLMNLHIFIPGKCRNDGKDAQISEGFGTPLTLFIKNKTSYDCIRGYVDKNTLINKLKEISFIN